MTNFKKGEIYLAEIIFIDGIATKKRPVAIISGRQFNEKREEVVVAAITSNVIRKIYGDLPIKHWEKAGLLFPSAVTGIILSIKKTLIAKKLGQLDKEDISNVEECLRKILELHEGSGNRGTKT